MVGVRSAVRLPRPVAVGALAALEAHASARSSQATPRRSLHAALRAARPHLLLLAAPPAAADSVLVGKMTRGPPMRFDARDG